MHKPPYSSAKLNLRLPLATIMFGVLVLLSSAIIQSNAQSPPVPPPPAPSIEGSNEEDVREPRQSDDKSAPVIEILTKELVEGKNLIRARVSDNSSIAFVKVRYAEGGFITSADLVLEGGTTYKGLVSVLPPSSILVFEAVDTDGNIGQASKWFSVSPIQKNFIDQFLGWLRSLFS